MCTSSVCTVGGIVPHPGVPSTGVHNVDITIALLAPVSWALQAILVSNPQAYCVSAAQLRCSRRRCALRTSLHTAALLVVLRHNLPHLRFRGRLLFLHISMGDSPRGHPNRGLSAHRPVVRRPSILRTQRNYSRQASHPYPEKSPYAFRPFHPPPATRTTDCWSRITTQHAVVPPVPHHALVAGEASAHKSEFVRLCGTNSVDRRSHWSSSVSFIVILHCSSPDLSSKGVV